MNTGNPEENSHDGLPERPATEPTIPEYQGEHTEPISRSATENPTTEIPREFSRELPGEVSAEPAQAQQPQYPAPITPYTQPHKKREKRRFGAPTVLVASLGAGLLGGISVVGANALLGNGGAGTAELGNQNSPITVNNPNSSTATTAAAQKAAPSVVTISATNPGNDRESGTGSGVVLDEQGNILTNAHVVTLGGQVGEPQLEVQLSDSKVYPATIVGLDPTNDLAVINVQAENLTPATLGDSSKINVGDSAIAIGAPLGLSNTVTDGIVSTLNRTISIQSSEVPEEDDSQESPEPDDSWNWAPPGEGQNRMQNSGGTVYLNVLQTDAAINPGNSGGPLVNQQGEVIGINVAIASAGNSSLSGEAGNIGVGFAIPINNAKRIAEEVIANGKATHGYLGVSVTGVAPEGQERSAFSAGAKISKVEPDSPASKAGLKEADIITKVNERNISDSRELTATVREFSSDSTVTVTYLRDGKENTAEVQLSARPSQ